MVQKPWVSSSQTDLARFECGDWCSQIWRGLRLMYPGLTWSETDFARFDMNWDGFSQIWRSETDLTEFDIVWDWFSQIWRSETDLTEFDIVWDWFSQVWRGLRRIYLGLTCTLITRVCTHGIWFRKDYHRSINKKTLNFQPLRGLIQGGYFVLY